MSNLLEIKKVGNNPVLVTTSDYNALDFSEKLKCISFINSFKKVSG